MSPAKLANTRISTNCAQKSPRSLIYTTKLTRVTFPNLLLRSAPNNSPYS